MARDWPEVRSKAVQPHVVFDDGFQNGWRDASWNAWVQPRQQSSKSGMLDSPAVCASIKYQVSLVPNLLFSLLIKATSVFINLTYLASSSSQGALSFQASNGVFQGHLALEFWTYVGVAGWEGTQAKIPDVTISISGTKVNLLNNVFLSDHISHQCCTVMQSNDLCSCFCPLLSVHR